jgi:hypothetical protein
LADDLGFAVACSNTRASRLNRSSALNKPEYTHLENWSGRGVPFATTSFMQAVQLSRRRSQV